jgi:hexosaminidase
MNDVVKAGFKALLSTGWYLDHLNVPWESMYLNEPTQVLSKSANASLILGGEACMWGETVDKSNIDNTVWPRAAAVAERLWTPLKKIQPVNLAVTRLHEIRCLLNRRGIAAAPVLLRGRTAPLEFSSCYSQRRMQTDIE